VALHLSPGTIPHSWPGSPLIADASHIHHCNTYVLYPETDNQVNTSKEGNIYLSVIMTCPKSGYASLGTPDRRVEYSVGRQCQDECQNSSVER
jgi:hypothetical protein